MSVEVPEEKMVKLFLKKIKATKKKYMDAIIRCNALEDQSQVEMLRSAVNAISNTIAALTQKTASLSDLKRFHIKVDLVDDPYSYPAEVKLELRQKERSHPLPLNHKIVVKPPMGDSISTKLVKERNQKMNYVHKFNFGPAVESTVRMVTGGDMEFDLMRISNVMGNKKEQLVALATAPLNQLSFSSSLTIPLHFVNIDGSKTQFIFEAIFTVERPLVPLEDLRIDENIDVIPE